MKNFLQAGDIVTATAPAGGVSSGDGMLFGNLFGVASTAADEGASVSMVTHGVFRLPKLAAAVISAGGNVSWDSTNGYCVAPGAGFYPIGTAMAAAPGGSTSVVVRLDGIATAVAA